MAGQGELYENAVDFRPCVQFPYQVQKLIGRHRSGLGDRFAVHAEIARGLRLVADVNLGRGIISHQDDGEPGGASRVGNKALNARQALGFYLVADTITIENQGHQTNVTDGLFRGVHGSFLFGARRRQNVRQAVISFVTRILEDRTFDLSHQKLS